MRAPVINLMDITLRPLAASDAGAITAGMQTRAVAEMLTSPPWPYRLPDADDFIADAGAGPFCWAIVGPDLMGAVEIGRELGYWLAPSYWGRGIMPRAARAAIDHYFAETNADHGPSGYLLGNIRSAGVLTRLGFQETGRTRVHVNSRGRDAIKVDMILKRRDLCQRAA